MVRPANEADRRYDSYDPIDPSTNDASSNLASIRPTLRAAQPSAPPPATTTRIDDDLRAFVDANRTTQPVQLVAARSPTAGSAPRNDAILYVGMSSESNSTELAALRATGANVTGVLQRTDTSVELDGRRYSLATPEGCTEFGAALAQKHGLSSETGKALGTAIQSNDARGRDELAQIALVWAAAEVGGRMPSRIVLSGHSVGSDVHAGKEKLELASLRKLGAALPNAARQVEDIHFAGCFTSVQVVSTKMWEETFPNLKTMWGYSGFSPNAPVHHLAQWEGATRGRRASDPGQGTRGVTTWSANGIREPGVSLPLLQRGGVDADARFREHYSGEIRVSHPDTSLARTDYAFYRQLAARPELSEQQRTMFGAKADVLFRIRFYEQSVRGEFADEHGAKCKLAFEALGLPKPDFAALSRRDALATIRRFEEKLRLASPAPEIALEMSDVLAGFAKLEPKVIPDTWCH